MNKKSKNESEKIEDRIDRLQERKAAIEKRQAVVAARKKYWVDYAKKKGWKVKEFRDLTEAQYEEIKSQPDYPKMN